jgi:predicted dinucleotide-binding enzyme
LAEWWRQAGHDVIVCSSGADQGQSTYRRMRPPGVAAKEAAAYGDVVLFAPDWSAAHALVDEAAGALKGKPVLDATNPIVRHGDQGYERAVAEGHSGIEALAEWAPDAQWVKAFNTVEPSVLRRRRGRDPLLAEFICTDHRDARNAATRLIQDVGFAPFFAGGSANALLVETGGPLQQREIDVCDATEAFAAAIGGR